MTSSTETSRPMINPSVGNGPGKAKDDAFVIESSDREAADAKKVLGNQRFQEQNYISAIDLYTQAIAVLRNAVEHLHLDDDESKTYFKDTGMPIYLVNRAMCHLKVENFGSALIDVWDALELDPEPKIKAKAYYRQGLAHYALLETEKALSDFKNCLKLNPNDLKTRNYVTSLQKEIRIKKFCEAISKPDELPMSERMNLNDLIIPGNYDGPKWTEDCDNIESLMSSPMDLTFIRGLVDHFRNQRPLPNRLAAAIVKRTIELLKKDANCVDVTVDNGNDITVCGDVHGQFFDLINIFDLNGFPSPSNPYIFNGDFVDRGAWSVECALVLFACKVAFPSSFYLSRGNHETKNINKIYGFKGECDAKFRLPEIYELFSEAFMWLPLCHIINKQVFCVHGGLPSDDAQGITEINKLDRYTEPSDLETSSQVLLNDLLWADPRPEPGRVPSPRGVSSHFGPDVTNRFLKNNDLKYVIRSHEVKDNGYEVMHDGKMITVFSAPNYCDMVKNKGAFIKLAAPGLEPKYTTFSEVEHPSCSALQYASPLLRMQ